MTNFLPTFSGSMQTIHPSLQAAAEQLTHKQFIGLTEQARYDILQGRYDKLTRLLTRHDIEPTPEVVSQLCTGRQLFFGEGLPYNLWQALLNMPQTYGNEVVDGLFALRGEWKDWQIAQELVILCGPYFRGDFSRLMDRLNEMNPRRGDEAGLLSFNYGPSSLELTQALALDEGLAFLTSAFHGFRLALTRDFSIRRLAHAVGHNPLASMTVPEMRDIFCRGFHCTDESVRLSFFRLVPALCADPSVEEGVKVACFLAVRNAVQDDPSPAIRQAAAEILPRLDTPAALREPPID